MKTEAMTFFKSEMFALSESFKSIIFGRKFGSSSILCVPGEMPAGKDMRAVRNLEPGEQPTQRPSALGGAAYK